jgi:tRNA A-37 threonylcarbamoyl transferase component Bud32
MSEGSLLERLQQQVADGQPVDWAAVESALHGSADTTAEELEQIGLLRLLDQIGLAHRELQTGPSSEADLPHTIAAPPVADDETLAVWGRYRLEQKVGHGGFGSVYRGWDPMLEMSVAIKILHPRFSDRRLRARLVDEGRALARVEHQNVVRVLNVEEHDGRLGLVMEFVSGETLDALVDRQGALSEREAMGLGEEVCRALAAVHAHKLIHRDVKARNIMRERAGRIVLMDFGAGLPESAAQKGAVGTPLYMAPETLRGEPASVASDVYSVGVLLFFLVTRRYPYEGRTIDEVRAAQKAGIPQSLLSLRPGLSLSFVRVVERALATGPGDRYPSAAELLKALDKQQSAGRGRRLLLQATAAVIAPPVVIILAGMLTGVAYDRTLGRRDYSHEGISEWFVLGLRSLVLPFVLTALAVGLVGFVVAVRKVLLRSSSRLRRRDLTFGRRMAAAAQRLSLTELDVQAAWLVLITALGAIAVTAYWAPLWQAVTSNIGAAPAETLAVLSPFFDAYRVHYRMALSLLGAGSIAAWYALARVARAERTPLPAWFRTTEIAILVLLFGSMQVPNRFLTYDVERHAIAAWSGQRCYVLGERGDEMLLFCPQMSPRHKTARRSDVRIESPTGGESLFSAFDPNAKR